jgi:hypothetical protein
MKPSLFIVLTLLLSACGEAEFKKFSELGELRVMGIVADVPEVDGGSSTDVNVTLTPYISDKDGGGRTFNVTVLTCLDPGIGNGAEAECENPGTETYPNSNTFNTAGLAGSDYTGAMDPITITITNPAAKIASYSRQQRYNGVNYIVIFKFESGGSSITVIKSIPITDRGTLNSNPVIDQVTLGGGGLANSPTANGELNVTYTAGGGPQNFNTMSSSGAISSSTESYIVTWFYIKGKVVPGRVLYPTKSNYTHDATATLVAVVKDLRGGTAVRVLTP